MHLAKLHYRFGLALLLAGGLLAPARLGHTQQASAVATPFTLEWTAGLCKHCGVARQLGELRFTRANEAWAIGLWRPSGGDLSGGYIIVHTLDAGKTWRELRSSETHTVEPAFSFVDALHGWVSGMSPVGESWVFQTMDAGRHWRRVSDQDLQGAIFFDGVQAYGRAANHFLRSSDGGQNWTESELPQVKFIDRMFFLNPQIGWIAGSDGEDAIILRTSDGGQHWEESRIHASTKTAEVRDVYFLNPQQGWLITWPFHDEGTHLFRTQDGGKTWEADPDASFQGARNWLSGVRFVGDKLAWGFGRRDLGGGKEQGLLLYSHDAGDHWQKFDLPRSVYDCQAFEGNLLCSAHSGETGLFLLKIHPLPLK